MGMLKKLKLGEKKRNQEMNEKVEEFREEVRKLGKKFDMTIVPIMERYGLSLEIQVLSDRQKEEIDNREIEKGNVEHLSKKI
jgi:hypothetical protein